MAEDDVPMATPAEEPLLPQDAASQEPILTIYVAKMARTTTAETLREACGKFGEVTGVTKRVPRTFGYVDFAERSCVDAALAAGTVEVDGEIATIAEKDLTKARPPVAPGDVLPLPEDYVNTSVIVRDIDSDVKREDISDLFSKYGTVTKVEIRRRPYVCYAFVKFDTAEEMQGALAAADSLQLDGKPVKIEERRPPRPSAAQGREGPVVEHSIYIRDFPADTTDDELRDAFRPYGPIKSLIKRVKSYDDEQNGGGMVTRTWAFVEYEAADSVEKAMAANEHPELNGATLTVEKRSSQPVALVRGRGGRRGGRYQRRRANERLPDKENEVENVID
mmetsp:Transcript_8460/g.31869  ORF Transcript_8460/g.31869 Transcript_8460/m.31869 type:complete len:335 (+) Transcript_8460:151-1155(+)